MTLGWSWEATTSSPLFCPTSLSRCSLCACIATIMPASAYVPHRSSLNAVRTAQRHRAVV